MAFHTVDGVRTKIIRIKIGVSSSRVKHEHKRSRKEGGESDSVVSRRREGGHASYRPLLNKQANKKEQRGVIRFLAVEGVGGREMHRRIKKVHCFPFDTGIYLIIYLSLLHLPHPQYVLFLKRPPLQPIPYPLHPRIQIKPQNSVEKKRSPKNQSNTIKPKIEIKMAPHRPRKSAPTEYAMDEEDMIIYDVKDEPESNPKYVLNMNGYTYKGELVKESKHAFIRYDFDNPIRKPC
ncbi:hypothetical protein TNCV_940391 [Trichonephila clavipes]|nr:hypothetical protein TNCV_940391 [Trichonephila clavipes]